MQRLSDFNARLARAVDLGPDVGSTQVEQAAAHVLECSVIFLGIVNFLQSSGRRDVETHEGSRKRQRERSNTQSTGSVGSLDGHDDHDSENEDDMVISNDNNNNNSSSRSSNENNVITNNGGSNHRDSRVEDVDAVAGASFLTGPFTPDMATVLQLVVFSMRLTELHHDLYSAIYRYLQQHEHVRNMTDATNVTSSFSPSTAARSLFPIPVFLTIAGVALAPHPRFQLELVLQAGAHYLERSKRNPTILITPFQIIAPDELTSVGFTLSSRRPERPQGAPARRVSPPANDPPAAVGERGATRASVDDAGSARAHGRDPGGVGQVAGRV